MMSIMERDVAGIQGMLFEGWELDCDQAVFDGRTPDLILIYILMEEFGKTGAARSAVKNDFPGVDRKSTRLNSSHGYISYAVFCLKKTFFNDTATTEIYTLSLHDALPIFDCCGENRVQEIQAKRPLGAYTGRPLHFIGHLQTNKVKYLVGVVDLIESVDRLELLECIEKQAEKMGVVQNILFEVNIGAEESKSGFTKEEAAALAARMREFPHVALKGLMAIPPVSEFPGENCRYFAEMRNLFVDIKAKKYDNVSMECLSMGMSDDFTDAIAEGSTMVRIGTAIFGKRNYNT